MNYFNKELFVNFLFCLCAFLLTSCIGSQKKEQTETPTITNIVRIIKDTIHLNDFKIINLYKQQFLVYDSINRLSDSGAIKKLLNDQLMIPYPGIFDSCFKQTSSEFAIAHIKNIKDNWKKIQKEVTNLVTMDLDSVFKYNVQRVVSFSKQKIEGTWYIYFFPENICDMCGCGLNSMQVNLANSGNRNLNYLSRLIPHELNHNIYDLLKANDPDRETVLSNILNEGFATYFTCQFTGCSIEESFFDDTLKKVNWFFDHEKEIYKKARPILFSVKDADWEPLHVDSPDSFIKGSPGKAGYFIGYRIIEEYVKIYGKDSWRDIYKKPTRTILRESNYDKLMSGLE